MGWPKECWRLAGLLMLCVIGNVVTIGALGIAFGSGHLCCCDSCMGGGSVASAPIEGGGTVIVAIVAVSQDLG